MNRTTCDAGSTAYGSPGRIGHKDSRQPVFGEACAQRPVRSYRWLPPGIPRPCPRRAYQHPTTVLIIVCILSCGQVATGVPGDAQGDQDGAD